MKLKEILAKMDDLRYFTEQKELLERKRDRLENSNDYKEKIEALERTIEGLLETEII